MTVESDIQKVFCIGFQKTGTTSMETALSLMNYRVASVFGRDMQLATLRKVFVQRGIEIARRCDAVQDMPWPLLFEDLDRTFPRSKFILTVRDEDAWWLSILGHFGRNTDVMQQLVYGSDAGAPFGNERRYRRIYREHNNRVRDYFAGRDNDFLELNFSGRIGWVEICQFLKRPIPNSPFPQSNQPRQQPSIKRTLRRKSLLLANRIVGSRTS